MHWVFNQAHFQHHHHHLKPLLLLDYKVIDLPACRCAQDMQHHVQHWNPHSFVILIIKV